MNTFSINIGRNIKNVPMPDERWFEFRQHVLRLAQEWAGTDPDAAIVINTFDGVNTWDGVSEESFKVEAVVDFSFANIHIVGLRYALIEAAGMFEQDAIGFSTGQSVLLWNS